LRSKWRVSTMVTLSKIYTKTGDSGETGLGDGSRVSKASLRIAAIGAVDETNSAIGIARLDAEADADAMLARIQNDLFDLGADLCAPEDGRKAPSSHQKGRLRIAAAQVERLEREIDIMNAALSPLTSFVLPGGTALAAHLHLARAIARRAEAAIVALAAEEDINDAARRYANRLSDHLFVMARAANNAGMGDVLWIPGENR
jgi:cob(I)alamin adenosyltransferase